MTDAAKSQIPSASVTIPADRALPIAQGDAAKAHHDLTPYRIQIALERDGWHVRYDLKDPKRKGGGASYVIDAENGSIISKRYQQ